MCIKPLFVIKSTHLTLISTLKWKRGNLIKKVLKSRFIALFVDIIAFMSMSRDIIRKTVGHLLCYRDIMGMFHIKLIILFILQSHINIYRYYKRIVSNVVMHLYSLLIY